MGCDIHIWAEHKSKDGYEPVNDMRFAEGPAPFDWRSYGMFGFLANVRNYSVVPVISEPRGIPTDAHNEAREELDWCHSCSWVSVTELSNFDYDQSFEDRRVTVQTGPNSWNGGATAAIGGGTATTIRDFLGEAFFEDLEKLVACGAERIVFGFDS